jgi:hypothetical protein
MLKSPTSSAAFHSSRRKLASTIANSNGKLSIEEQSLPYTHQTMAAVQQRPKEQEKPKQPPVVYFPLGYKEAAYQWV